MTDAEMRGQDMQDAPERIWAVTSLGMVGSGRWVTQGAENPHGNIGYTRTDLCVTEAECQRRVDAAVAELVKALHEIEDYALAFADMETVSDMADEAIRARGQK